MTPASVAGLRAQGAVEISAPFANLVGSYQGILYDPAAGCHHGGTEPRFDGRAMGF